MDQRQDNSQRAKKMKLLSQTTRETPMGKLLRKFWQPVALAEKIAAGAATAVRVFGEDLTLYRGESGQPYLVDGKCAHRRTLLHTGWVEGERIRCMYHGWQYDGTGQCVHRPAERDAGLPDIRIAGYPVREYGGLIFAYLGEGQPPEFELPRKDCLDKPGTLIFPRLEIWPTNWFQEVENTMDAVHVSFVHRTGSVGNFGQAVNAAIPELKYVETDAGIRQIATRPNNQVRFSDWTFPNNNHIDAPGLKPDDPWFDIIVWMVPADDVRTLRFQLYVSPPSTEEANRRIKQYFQDYGDYSPADHHQELFDDHRYPQDVLVQLTSAQDYVAQVGQGAVADREHEYLGRSDLGIAFLRKIFWREMQAIQNGKPTKKWRKQEGVPDTLTQVLQTAAGE